MNTKALLVIGTIGIGALSLMSFGKASKQPIPTTLVDPPQPDPVVIPDIVIPDVVIPDPVVIPDIVELLENEYTQHEKGFKLEIVKINKSSFSGGKYVTDVDLKISNWNDKPMLASEIKKIDITRTDTNSSIGVIPVDFKDISIPTSQSVVFSNIIVTVSSLLTRYVLDRLLTTVIYGYVDPTVEIEAGNTLTSNQYVVKDKNVLAYVTKRTSMGYNNSPLVDLGYNVVVENNTDEPFYLQDVKAVRMSIKYGYGYEEVVLQPFNFSNIRIDAHDQTELIDMVFSAPRKYDIKTFSFIGWTQRLIDTDDMFLKGRTKLELLF